MLREDLYSYDAQAEKKFAEVYTTGFDRTNIKKVTNIKVEVKHSESEENASGGAVDDGIDAYYQRVTVSFEYRYNNNEADVYKPDPIVYPNNYFRAAASGSNSYRISTNSC